MTDFYSKQGIIHQKTYVESLQQNGAVEWKNQQILNVSQALQFQTSIYLFFLNDLVLIATYLINLTPSPHLQNTTPYHLFFNKTPDILT